MNKFYVIVTRVAMEAMDMDAKPLNRGLKVSVSALLSEDGLIYEIGASEVTREELSVVLAIIAKALTNPD